ncbi:hypothetical protein PMAYCL1PPCAC_25670, partial [Pristionchus mayeri]
KSFSQNAQLGQLKPKEEPMGENDAAAVAAAAAASAAAEVPINSSADATGVLVPKQEPLDEEERRQERVKAQRAEARAALIRKMNGAPGQGGAQIKGNGVPPPIPRTQLPKQQKEVKVEERKVRKDDKKRRDEKKKEEGKREEKKEEKK